MNHVFYRSEMDIEEVARENTTLIFNRRNNLHRLIAVSGLEK